MAEASQSAAEFVAVADATALEELFARSQDAPVVLFKHSTTCPISARAHRQMSQLSRDAVGDVALVVVQTARPLSNEIARRTGVEHHSPQAIILRGGKAVWDASHFDITADAVERAVRDSQ
ncbi:MAG TPA: bacillithiol system redox-active protein YtxJ [Pyrinomonadaceae bacterium]|jgi:bacillithiol system protein YtxJ|nr:bacillithiol system redox-active protein YtxJ [Pyrinomonadaceae bacterium]